VARALREPIRARLRSAIKILNLSQACIDFRDTRFSFRSCGTVRKLATTPLHGARCQSYGDHRIAMMLAIAGLIASGETIIEGAECVDVSYPGFFDALGELTDGAATLTAAGHDPRAPKGA